MTVFTGIMLYVIIWFVVLFTVLPWGVKAPEHVEPGHAEGAPDRPRLGLKAIVTTGIAALVWAIIYLLIDYEIVSFRPE